MRAGGISRRLPSVADEILGHFTGGLALATIATCVVFAAMSESEPATVVAIGGLTIPALIGLQQLSWPVSGANGVLM